MPESKHAAPRRASARRTGVKIGVPGFEPGVTGPKPVALPLGYTPRTEVSPPGKPGSHSTCDPPIGGVGTVSKSSDVSALRRGAHWAHPRKCALCASTQNYDVSSWFLRQRALLWTI